MKKVIINSIAYSYIILIIGISIWVSNRQMPQTIEFSSHGFQFAISSDLLKSTEEFYNFVSQETKGLTPENCSPILNGIFKQLIETDPLYFDISKVKIDHEKISEYLWRSRLAMRERLAGFTRSVRFIKDQSLEHSCVEALRNGLRVNRYLEEFVTEFALNPKPFDGKNDPKSYMTMKGDFPQMLINPKYKGIRIKSGDVFLSRGNAFSSAAITRIGKVDSQFSHLSIVYFNFPKGSDTELTVDEAAKNKKVVIVSAHIEVGSTIQTFGEYLGAGNARIVQFRYPNKKKAHEAALVAYDMATSHQRLSRLRHPEWSSNDVNHNLPYDFHMNLEDPSEIFCSEMVYWGFKSQQIDIPLFKTVIRDNNDIVRRLEINSGEVFAPSDIELDPRFELISEWKDLRKLQNLRHKDAILSEMFRWMNELDYRFFPKVFHTAKALFAWLMRQADVGFVKENLPRNMNVKMINTIFVLDSIGKKLQDALVSKENYYKLRNTGLPLAYPLMKRELEKLRVQDLDNFERGKSSQFHYEFMPEELSRPELESEVNL